MKDEAASNVPAEKLRRYIDARADASPWARKITNVVKPSSRSRTALAWREGQAALPDDLLSVLLAPDESGRSKERADVVFPSISRHQPIWSAPNASRCSGVDGCYGDCVLRLLPYLLALLVSGGLAGCAGSDTLGRSPANYINPVLDADFPDPAVMMASDGFYYAYATQGGAAATRNIQLARSRDLVDWQVLGDALPVKPGWASRTQDFWAPHVLEDAGRYILYYSAKPDAALADPTKGLCLAVATADRPSGPFTDSGRPLLCGPGFVNIDPMPFDDPATGKRLLYWGSGFGPIKVQELAPDRLSFAPGSVAVDLLHPIKSDDPAEYGRLVEGAWVLRRGGWYYLFYSGDNCCGPKAHYAAMVARSRSATGPFRTLTSAKGTRGDVILERRGRWIAPGHNSIVEDAAGRHWIVYHAVDQQRARSKPGDDINSRRILLIDPIDWVGGWPRVSDDGPSAVAQRRPAVSPRRAK